MKAGTKVSNLSKLQIICVLVLAGTSCTSETKVSKEDSSEEATSGADLAKREATPISTSDPPHLSQSELERFSKKAKRGDVDAMYTLSTHYFVSGDIKLGYHWLGEAAKLGECHAILHLTENTFRGVTPVELAHWRKEKKRLGCDPMRDDIVKPEIRMNGVLQPEQ